MEEFSAEHFYLIGVSLRIMVEVSNDCEPNEKLGDLQPFFEQIENIANQCVPIGLTASADLAKAIRRRIDADWTGETLKGWVEALDTAIRSEASRELFLWVSTERAPHYKKTAEELLGEQCLARFKDARIDREATEATRCYALGRFTACAFHLMRMTEAALCAFAITIAYVPRNNKWNWGEVFREYDRQFVLAPKDRPAFWKTHGEFLQDICGDLRATPKNLAQSRIPFGCVLLATRGRISIESYPGICAPPSDGC